MVHKFVPFLYLYMKVSVSFADCHVSSLFFSQISGMYPIWLHNIQLFGVNKFSFLFTYWDASYPNHPVFPLFFSTVEVWNTVEGNRKAFC